MNTNARERIDFAELRPALDALLTRYRGTPAPITNLRRRLSGYSSSYTIENLAVELADGTHLQLVLKNLSPGSVLQTAKKIRPGFLYHPRNEIITYQQILAPQALGTPICYGAVEHPARDQYWLFLERVNGPLLWQVAGGETWNDAARWLARLHTAFPDAARQRENPHWQHLLHHDTAFYQIWPVRAAEFVGQRNLAADPATQTRFRQLLDGYSQVIDRLVSLPVHFIHGEFYPSTVLVEVDTAPHRICPVDWEMASLGPGLMDLATLTSGDWKETDQFAMISAYRDALCRLGSATLTLPAMIEAVDYCRLHLAVQLLGWSADWHPPERHAQNWFSEALRLANRLGLTKS